MESSILTVLDSPSVNLQLHPLLWWIHFRMYHSIELTEFPELVREGNDKLCLLTSRSSHYERQIPLVDESTCIFKFFNIGYNRPYDWSQYGTYPLDFYVGLRECFGLLKFKVILQVMDDWKTVKTTHYLVHLSNQHGLYWIPDVKRILSQSP